MLLSQKVIAVTSPVNTSISQDAGMKIQGVIFLQGVNIECRVRLFEKQTGRLIYDVKSDKNGRYKFTKLPFSNFFIVAHHPKSQYNAVIQDNVVPK